MSETICIHGLPVDPYPVPCGKCEQEAAPLRDTEAERLAALDLAIRRTMEEN